MNLLNQQLSSLQIEHNLTEDCVVKIKQQCCAHAINCSMDTQLLEESSAWLVDQIISHIESNLPLSAVEAVQQEQNKTIEETDRVKQKIATAEQLIKNASVL